MDFEKLADKFIEEGGWQGSPRIAIELFAKWLAEQEAAQQSVHWTGGDSVGFCELHQISFLQAECPRCHPASQ